MEDLLKNLKELGFLQDDELAYVEGVLKSEPYPQTAKELGEIIREARKHAKNKKET